MGAAAKLGEAVGLVGKHREENEPAAPSAEGKEAK